MYKYAQLLWYVWPVHRCRPAEDNLTHSAVWSTALRLIFSQSFVLPTTPRLTLPEGLHKNILCVTDHFQANQYFLTRGSRGYKHPFLSLGDIYTPLLNRRLPLYKDRGDTNIPHIIYLEVYQLWYTYFGLVRDNWISRSVLPWDLCENFKL